MEIILSEKDIGSAIKLYLAFSGVTRTVSTLEFARKLRGDDAGISVSLDLEDAEMTAEDLAKLAMSQSNARGLNNRVSGKPVTATKAATPANATTETTTDEAIPFTTAEEDSGLSAEREQELTAQADEAYEDPSVANPFGETDPDPVEDPEPVAVEATAVEGNDVPDSSPFAQTEATTEASGNSEETEDFSPPDVDGDSNPFGDMDSDEPVVAEAAEEPKAPVNLFG